MGNYIAPFVVPVTVAMLARGITRLTPLQNQEIETLRTSEAGSPRAGPPPGKTVPRQNARPGKAVAGPGVHPGGLA
jgi:hypothetical protein